MAQAVPSERTHILQQSCSDKDLPSEVRLSFITKVYGIVATMLLVSFGIASPFAFHPDTTMKYVAVDHPWILGVACVAFLAQVILNWVVVIGMCCAPGILDMYLNMFKTVPYNYLYLGVTSCTFGFLVGVICTQYTASSIVFVFILCFAMILALTAYAFYTKADVTGMGMYLFAALIGLALLGFASMLIGGPFMNKVYAACGATLFGFLIVYDTQLIFGSASNHDRAHEYTIDMYAFAAFQLYMDIINFFIYMLRLLGDRR